MAKRWKTPRTWAHLWDLWVIPNLSVGPRIVTRPPCPKILNSFGREHQKGRRFSPMCWRFWWCHGHCYSAEQNCCFFCASLQSLSSAGSWHMHWTSEDGHMLVFRIEPSMRGSIPMTKYSGKNNSHICCRVEVTRIFFQIFRYNAACNIKSAEDYFMNLSSTPENVLLHIIFPFETNGQQQ